ncbi:MAG: OsmC family protein [Candidatus Cyclobacteriaceae bacterium M2_1C_046]
MTTLKNKYLGDLRTEAVHTRSGSKIITDAPIDNHGKGEAFSPTDMLGAALSTCMLTVMGIEARKLGVDMRGMETEVVKEMSAAPRKISRLKIRVSHPNLQATEEQKEILTQRALTCPVALSLSDDLDQDVTFNF